jgi:hypothetical protein
LAAGVGLASVDLWELFLWDDFLVDFVEVVVPEASVFLVVVVDSLEVSEDVAGLAVGAGAADCWAMAAIGNARARARTRTFFIFSPLSRCLLASRLREKSYAGADEPNMNVVTKGRIARLLAAS